MAMHEKMKAKYTAQTEHAKIEGVQDWYFTFGVGMANAGRYVVIRGTHESARQRMFDLFGKHWAFQYPEADGPNGAGVAKWRLERLAID